MQVRAWGLTESKEKVFFLDILFHRMSVPNRTGEFFLRDYYRL